MATEQTPLNKWVQGRELTSLYRRCHTPQAFRRPYGVEAVARTEFFGPQTVGFTLTAETGSFTYIGIDTSLEFNRLLIAASTSYTLNGTDAGLKFGRMIEALGGSFVWTGIDAVLLKSEGGYSMTCVRRPGARQMLIGM